MNLESLNYVCKTKTTKTIDAVAVFSSGHAAAGGALLSLAFDIRVMRKDRGYFYINEVRIGLPIQGLLKELAR